MSTVRPFFDSIDALDDLVHGAKPIPLTDLVRVDKEKIYDLIDPYRGGKPVAPPSAPGESPAG